MTAYILHVICIPEILVNSTSIIRFPLISNITVK
jgi:hypothetical protein